MRQAVTRALGVTALSLVVGLAPLVVLGGPAVAQPARVASGTVQRFIIGMAQGTRPTAAQLTRIGAVAGDPLVLGRSLGGGYYTASLAVAMAQPDGRRAAARVLSEMPEVAAIVPDATVQAADAYPGTPESRTGEQWDLWDDQLPAGGYSVRAPAAWASTDGSADTVVAVIDTGLTTHPDLVGQTVPGYDLISDPEVAGDGDGWDDDPTDEGDWCAGSDSSWHGTHVTGTIVAKRDGQGVAGVAPGVRVQMVRILGACGGSLSDLIAAIRWSAGDSLGGGVTVNQTPAQVISMSLAAPMTCPAALGAAVRYATDHGAVVIAAAGNDATDAAGATPANCPGVHAVAATGRAGQRAAYSNFGAKVAIAAPGGSDGNKVLSTSNSGTRTAATPSYRAMQGTSMATPHVAAAVALVRSAHPSWTGAQAWAAVAANARPFPEGTVRDCTTATCGVGLLDLVGLLPDPAGTYAVSGTVRRAGVGSPDVDVTALPAAGGINYYGHTLADGTYHVAVPPGSYRLRFTQDAREWTTGELTISAGMTGIDVDWPARGSLAGQVVLGGDQQPLPGARVGVAAGSSAAMLRTVTTDAQGQFRFDDLRAGSYRLRAESPGGVTGWLGGADYASATELAVTDGVAVAGLQIALQAQPIVAPAATSASPAGSGSSVGPAPGSSQTPTLTPAPAAVMPVPELRARRGTRLLPGTPRLRVRFDQPVTLTALVADPATQVEFSDSAGVLATAPVVSGRATLRTTLRGGSQVLTARVVAPLAGAPGAGIVVRVSDRTRPSVKLRWSRPSGIRTAAVAVTARDGGGLAAVLVRVRIGGRWGDWTEVHRVSVGAVVGDLSPAGWAGVGCIQVRAQDFAGNRRTVRRCS